MQIGCHVSISGSVSAAVDNAVERKCSAFQIFTRSPRSWYAKNLDKEIITNFKTKLENSEIENSGLVVHMPYLPNLASPNDEPFKKSVATLTSEVERCDVLGIPYLVTHLGSHLGSGEAAGIKRLVMAFKSAVKDKKKVTILLENTAGQKNSVGSKFTQLQEILKQLQPIDRFGICMDTCHTFAAGYDLSSTKAVKDTFGMISDTVGSDSLKVIHLNDSKGEMGSNLDRHDHIGLGKIGLEGMKTVVRYADKNKLPVILETPINEIRDDFENIKIAKSLA